MSKPQNDKRYLFPWNEEYAINTMQCVLRDGSPIVRISDFIGDSCCVETADGRKIRIDSRFGTAYNKGTEPSDNDAFCYVDLSQVLSDKAPRRPGPSLDEIADRKKATRELMRHMADVARNEINQRDLEDDEDDEEDDPLFVHLVIQKDPFDEVHHVIKADREEVKAKVIKYIDETVDFINKHK